jgi:hypothetical protein
MAARFPGQAKKTWAASRRTKDANRPEIPAPENCRGKYKHGAGLHRRFFGREFSNMKTATKSKTASASDVVQAELAVSKQRSTAIGPTSVRLPPEILAKIPHGVSVAKFIKRLVKCKIGFYDEEVFRYAAWSAVSLDRLISEVATRLPDNANEPLSRQIDRLIVLAEFTAEITSLRKIMEKALYATR